VHHRIGIRATYKPVNDLVVDNRKISGTGAGEIGDCVVFVGNLIIDFDYETMSRVLKIPDEKFRDKVKKTIEENLSTIRIELGKENANRWKENILNNMMAEEFSKIVGPMTVSGKDDLPTEKMEEMRESMMNEDWLHRKGKNFEGCIVKIKSGLEIVHKIHKATGGLIKTEFFVEDGYYREVSISGDYFCLPKESINLLESAIECSPTNGITDVITKFYCRDNFDIPGVEIDDWVKAFTVS